MDQPTQKIYDEIQCLASFEPTKLDKGGLTYAEVTDMLVWTRRLKTFLEIKQAAFENDM